AEVPPFACGGRKRRPGVEQRSGVARLAGVLVVGEEGRAPALDAEDDVHRVPAGVVVDVAPVGVADVVDTVGAARSGAVALVREADARGVVRRREREPAAGRQKRLGLSVRHRRAKAVVAGRRDETAGGTLRRYGTGAE